MRLRAYPNVIPLSEERRKREQAVRVVFPGFVSRRSATEEIAPPKRAKENACEAFVHLQPVQDE